jgi:hypothetical protein
MHIQQLLVGQAVTVVYVKVVRNLLRQKILMTKSPR